ncbi:MAG: hypothetical protein JWP00_1812 [Chloroflexi bacterium]|jgi:hypothetical protein|nr:hypothetical protein [Chloroflexota bacterium]
MNQIKAAALYILALIVLLAPAIILGWIGFSLIGWFGLVIGVLAGLVIFAVSVNKIAAQEDAEDETDSNHETPQAQTPEEQRPV